MTREQLLHFLPSLSDKEVVDLLAAANADPDEQAEWLPYYKMALSRLMKCCAILRVKAGEQDVGEAAKLYYQHLLFCGIGPRKDADVIVKCEEIAGNAMADFVQGPSAADEPLITGKVG